MSAENQPIAVIDTHRHLIGPKLRAKMVARGVWDDTKPLPQANNGDVVIYPDFANLDFSVEVQRKAGVTKAIASNGGEVEWIAKLLEINLVDALQFLADERLELRDAYPQDFEIMVDALALDERSLPIVERMVSKHGARAIAISSSYGEGKDQVFLDSPKAEWLWEYASANNLLVHIHPPIFSIGGEQLLQYRMIESVGRPFDTAVSAARMINSGLFDRHPQLQVLFVHMGGDVASILGRLDFNWRLNYHDVADPPDAKVIKARRPPSEYMRSNVYVDTMGFSEIGVRAAIAMCGIDRVVFGSDYGPVPFSPKEHIDIVNAVAANQAEAEDILWKTAGHIFNIDI